MRNKINELIKIARTVLNEIQKNEDIEKYILDECLSFDDNYITIYNSAYHNYKVYRFTFHTNKKERYESNIEISFEFEPNTRKIKVDVEDYLYFNTTRINKLVDNNKNLLKRFTEETNKILNTYKVERIAELEKELAELKS